MLVCVRTHCASAFQCRLQAHSTDGAQWVRQDHPAQHACRPAACVKEHRPRGTADREWRGCQLRAAQAGVRAAGGVCCACSLQAEFLLNLFWGRCVCSEGWSWFGSPESRCKNHALFGRGVVRCIGYRSLLMSAVIVGTLLVPCKQALFQLWERKPVELQCPVHCHAPSVEEETLLLVVYGHELQLTPCTEVSTAKVASRCPRACQLRLVSGLINGSTPRPDHCDMADRVFSWHQARQCCVCRCGNRYPESMGCDVHTPSHCF